MKASPLSKASEKTSAEAASAMPTVAVAECMKKNLRHRVSMDKVGPLMLRSSASNVQRKKRLKKRVACRTRGYTREKEDLRLRPHRRIAHRRD